MTVHPYAWILTIVIMGGIIVADMLLMRRRPHIPSAKECLVFVGVFVGLAIAFGIGVWGLEGPDMGGQFFAVWVTEYSLSIDNLFMFMILMDKFAVPEKLQQFALMCGIIIALVFRGVFIALGQAILATWAWVFFIFGAFLLYSAIDLVKDFVTGSDEDSEESAFSRWLREKMPTTGDYRGTRFLVRDDGHLLATSMFTVVMALGATDLVFALDSIPASYGLTSQAYLIFTANVFALMGLRQLYFLLGHALHKLVYLPLGLSAILGFIAVKLIGHALAHYHLDEKWFGVSTEIGVWTSLLFIIATLAVTTVASLLASRRSDSSDA